MLNPPQLEAVPRRQGAPNVVPTQAGTKVNTM
jgi:hypothetical protein